MLKRIYGVMILFAIALAILVYASSPWGTANLTGTVKFANGTAVNGNDDYGEIFLYEITEYLNTSYGVVANLSIQTTTIDSTGGYTFSNLDNGRLYILLAFYINSSDDYFISDMYPNGSIIMNSTFTTEFNSTYNVTFLNSSTGTAEYNITVEAV